VSERKFRSNTQHDMTVVFRDGQERARVKLGDNFIPFTRSLWECENGDWTEVDHHAELVAEAEAKPDELAELRAENAKLKQLAKARRATIKGLVKRLRAAGVRA
jgi:hypothetical protein